MAAVRLLLLTLGLWLAEWVLASLLPLLRILLDPLLLLFVFTGFRAHSTRFLWAAGLGFGALKDLSGGGLFGSWACAFALAGWILGGVRHWAEREDPVSAGIWTAGWLMGVRLLHAFGMMLADPAVAPGVIPWIALPFSMAIHGWLAAWGFQRLARFLDRGASRGHRGHDRNFRGHDREIYRVPGLPGSQPVG